MSVGTQKYSGGGPDPVPGRGVKNVQISAANSPPGDSAEGERRYHQYPARRNKLHKIVTKIFEKSGGKGRVDQVVERGDRPTLSEQLRLEYKAFSENIRSSKRSSLREISQVEGQIKDLGKKNPTRIKNSNYPTLICFTRNFKKE